MKTVEGDRYIGYSFFRFLQGGVTKITEVIIMEFFVTEDPLQGFDLFGIINEPGILVVYQQIFSESPL